MNLYEPKMLNKKLLSNHELSLSERVSKTRAIPSSAFYKIPIKRSVGNP